MIFVTVGTDRHFNRMVRVVDQWALEHGRGDVFAQIGVGAWQPEYIEFAHLLQPIEFIERVRSAKVIISHSGMGTILCALYHEKPILVVPKRAILGEHRNEHQSATARRLLASGRVNVAFGEEELRVKLDHLDELKAGAPVGKFAERSLLSGIREFIENTTW